MTQEIEIEFKNIVTKEEFDTLCKSFSIEAFTKQVNHYFETPDFSLKEAGSALRIRHKGATYTLTLKQPAEIGLLRNASSRNRRRSKNDDGNKHNHSRSSSRSITQITNSCFCFNIYG